MLSLRFGLKVACSQIRYVAKRTIRPFSATVAINDRIFNNNQAFNLEQKRQLEEVGRIEKIEVRYLGLPNDVTLVMNKGLSTPYDCAQHLTDIHCQKSVVGLIDGHTPWDIHSPIQDSCTLQLLRFTDADPHIANKTFWRSCSFMLGAVLTKIFKEHVKVNLHSFPSPNIRSGSFVYDITLRNQDWKPDRMELRALSAEMVKLSMQNVKFERLEVTHDFALNLFQDNPFKREQLPSISRNGSVTLYRLGDHIDISRGPMMSSTGHLGRTAISSVHKVAEVGEDIFYRVQGVALPKDIILNHFAFGVLIQRSEKLNPARLPTEQYEPPTFPFEKNIA